jgi:diacylglycerol kinase family enzyme
MNRRERIFPGDCKSGCGRGTKRQNAWSRAAAAARWRHRRRGCPDERLPGEATQIARQAYGRGVRRFIAVGGDGTSYEVVNGLYPEAIAGERPTLAFLPLGTGNSFLRDFSDRGVEHAIESMIRGTQPGRAMCCDCGIAKGVIYYINLLSMGFTADVATLRARRSAVGASWAM